MRKIILMFCFIMISLNTNFAQNKLGIEGQWLTKKKNSVVEIYKEGDKYFGKIVKIFPEKTENELKAKSGTIILKGFEEDDDVYEGELYVPKRDEYFDCEIEILDENTIELSISVFMISREFQWTRYKEEKTEK